jgi:hypothetical protein
MAEIRLRKKNERKTYNFPHVHGVKDYRKVLNFAVDKGWIDKTPMCTAIKKNCEPMCIGYRPGSTGRCIFQSEGPFRTECSRGRKS